MGIRNSLYPQHAEAREKRRHKELNARHLNAVYLCRKIVNDHDMDRKAECTQKDQEIPLLQLQGATHTQQIQTQNGDHHTDPQFGTHLLSEEQVEDGNNDGLLREKEGNGGEDGHLRGGALQRLAGSGGGALWRGEGVCGFDWLC